VSESRLDPEAKLNQDTNEMSYQFAGELFDPMMASLFSCLNTECIHVEERPGVKAGPNHGHSFRSPSVVGSEVERQYRFS
jgi:hypothetical protein